jgi:hypothetical protein
MKVAMKTVAVVLTLIAMGQTHATGADNVEFNYQARILVNEKPFVGIGILKLAIINDGSTVTLWSTDGASVAGSEPTLGVGVQVLGGILDMMVGDTALGMQPIPAVLFNDRDDLMLRAWFDDGIHGSQLLTPDRPIANARMLGLREATEDLTIYVDAATGDDLYSGLSPDRAKKTIQAAVNMAPKQVRECVVKIEIAPGTYAEQVQMYGIHTSFGGTFHVLGDVSTAVDEGTDPNVQIIGIGPLSYGISIRNCSQIMVEGILVSDAYIGFGLADSSLSLIRCKAIRNAYSGYFLARGSGVFVDSCWAVDNSTVGFLAHRCLEVDFQDCRAVENGTVGIQIDSTPWVRFRSCRADRNGQYGLNIHQNSLAVFYDDGSYSSNGAKGILARRNSYLRFDGSYGGTIQDNDEHGILLDYHSFADRATASNAFSGNGANTAAIRGSTFY